MEIVCLKAHHFLNVSIKLIKQVGLNVDVLHVLFISVSQQGNVSIETFFVEVIPIATSFNCRI